MYLNFKNKKIVTFLKSKIVGNLDIFRYKLTDTMNNFPRTETLGSIGHEGTKKYAKSTEHIVFQ